MNVLFLGGTGTISKAVTNLCVKQGINVTVVNRGNNNDILPNEVHTIQCDIFNRNDLTEKMKGLSFDCVVDFLAFTKKDVMKDYDIFKGKTTQFVFISSASAYQKPVLDYPITEETPLDNPYWEYSRNKQACEEYLMSVHSADFNVTIVRPSHTYDDTKLMTILKPWAGPFGLIDRLLKGKKVVIPGDGTSLWTITHNSDFANAFVPLLGEEKAYGETYHITSDKVYTWDRLTQIIANELQVKANIIHIPTDFIVQYLPQMEGELKGDKMWSAIFDNSKIKTIAKEYQSVVSYEDIAPIAVKHYLNNKEYQTIDREFEQIVDQMIEDYEN